MDQTICGVCGKADCEGEDEACDAWWYQLALSKWPSREKLDKLVIKPPQEWEW